MLKGHLDLLLLSVVGAGPAHGYAIIERLKERSGDAFTLAEGTVYPALHRLEAAKLLKSRWSKPAESPRRRRIYELTSGGRLALRSRSKDWTEFMQGINAVLGGTPWPTT